MRKLQCCKKSAVILLTVACLLLQGVVAPVCASAESPADQATYTGQAAADRQLVYTEYKSYRNYLEEHTAAALGEWKQEVSAAQMRPADAAASIVEEIDGKEAVRIPEDTGVHVPVEVEESGYYCVDLEYYPEKGGTSSIKLELQIDGETPFKEARSIQLKRLWQDADEKEYDSQENEIRLSAVETPVWMKTAVSDSTGTSAEPLRFWLEAGRHEITLSVYQNSMALHQLSLTPAKEWKSYAAVAAEYAEKQYKAALATQRIEAEEASRKSDRSIMRMQDKTSPVTQPYSCDKVAYNCIGGSNWKTVGEWLEWQVKVPESGLYTLVLRYKQSEKSGDISFRKLTIDGEVPFSEAVSLAFPYSNRWQTRALGDDNGSYLFYFSKGEHTIRLEASLGSYSELIAQASDLLTRLNGINGRIKAITGSSPDQDRDYQFEQSIPDTLTEMMAVGEELKWLEQQNGVLGGESSATFRRLYEQLRQMAEDPETIAKRLSSFSEDVTSLGTWINTAREQPLQLDYLMLSNEKVGVPEDKAGIWQTMRYYFRQLFASFFTDYANVGNKNADADRKITVWISSGRDQADIIRQMVNDSFTPQHDIGVNVQLVTEGALMPATLSGDGPDVYLGMREGLPVEYALRHAVLDLMQFDDAAETLTRFYPQSTTAFCLDEGIYALPETMSYPVLFYRKDVLSDLGIRKQDLTTWDNLLQRVLPELNMNNSQFGLPLAVGTAGYTSTLGCFLYQYGGSFYNDDNTASGLNSEQAIKAFETYTAMYTDYGIPLSYDFANRFRSGEMPLAVADITAYNQLSVFAPEIAELWGVCPLPGVEREDGTVDNRAVCTVTGSVILSTTDAADAAWTFLKWWTDSETQSRYGLELEAVMGTGARYASANIAAMQSVEWSKEFRAALIQQQKSLIGMPYIAGGYYTERNIEFAFRDVVYNGRNLREIIGETATEITNEITNKRREFYGEKEGGQNEK